MNFQSQIHKGWTLFLDRDGVINEEHVGHYITSWDEFKFCEGSLNAISQLSDMFDRLVVVSNQRGVGRGIMTIDTLKEIHSNMITSVNGEGGNILKVYACTSIDDNDHNRKPNTGMAVQAKEDFPEIDFKKSVMVGNNITDMEFGKRLGMYTIFLTTTHEPYELPHDLIDEQHPSLQDWANTLIEEPVE
ncbi:MAG: HAD-IIIA family hydrolase [Chitinophagales bacterium]|nr:HAD-IIIA family hydrolase [Chitinophagales bacterium]